jgi:hypothetical protein
LKDCILLLLKLAPLFTTKIISEYIQAYCTGKIDSIVPFDIEKIKSVIGEQISMEKQLIDAYDSMISEQKDLVKKFFVILS